MSQGRDGHALHRRRAGFHLRPHRPSPPPRARTSASRTSATRKLPEDRIDAVIGNVPFADLKLDYHGQKLSLHDYFFAKSIDALKPGGVLALVTSAFHARQAERRHPRVPGSKADFVGAIRLPSDAFKREGTAVVTDIVFLRKRAPGEPAHHADPDWLGVAPLAIEGAEVPINRYFLNHPEMVLGTWSRKDTLYGEGYSVTGNGDLAEQLAGSDPPPAGIRTRCKHLRPRNEPAPAFTPPPPRAPHHRRQLLRRRRPRPFASRRAGRPCPSSTAARR